MPIYILTKSGKSEAVSAFADRGRLTVQGRIVYTALLAALITGVGTPRMGENMAISGVTQYHYQYEPAYRTQNKNQTESKGKQETAKTDRAELTKSDASGSLSDKAKDYLEKLKQKYGNMDFYVADYATDQDAEQYLSRGTKEYSVLIDPQTLEKMAADDKEQLKLERTLDQAGAECGKIERALKAAGETVKSVGFSVDDKGTVKYFAAVDQIQQKQADRLSQKAEQKKSEGASDKNSSSKEIKASGSTIEELVENLKKARKEWEKQQAAAQEDKKKEYTPFEAYY